MRDDAILWVGPRREWTEPATIRDWPGVLLPGLVNAHAHLEYCGYADKCVPGIDFLEWISGFLPRNQATTAAQWLKSARRGVAESLRHGVTCVADITGRPQALEVVAASGLAGVSYVEAVGADDVRWPAVRDRLQDMLARAPATRITGVSPHALYTLGRTALRECAEAARSRHLRLHLHVAESPAESYYVTAGTGPFAAANIRYGLDMELMRSGGSGRTPVAELAALGLLGPDVHVAHGVHVDGADRALLRSHATAVALCPRSNRTLGVGTAPVAAYRAEGNQVAVGTDSLASVPSLDVLADVALLRELALAQGSPESGLDRWLIEAATVGGARAIGQTDVGVLRPGARADLAVINVAVAAGDDPYTAVVTGGAGQCVGTVLAGQVVHDRTGGDAATGVADGW